MSASRFLRWGRRAGTLDRWWDRRSTEHGAAAEPAAHHGRSAPHFWPPNRRSAELVPTSGAGREHITVTGAAGLAGPLRLPRHDHAAASGGDGESPAGRLVFVVAADRPDRS